MVVELDPVADHTTRMLLGFEPVPVCTLLLQRPDHPFDHAVLLLWTVRRPEFTSRAFIAWTQRHGIRHLLIQPGKPMQNGYIEGFNGKFRDECRNNHWFTSLQQAREVIASWRIDYSEVRPHSSCGRIPPAQFAANHRRQEEAKANSKPQTRVQ